MSYVISIMTCWLTIKSSHCDKYLKTNSSICIKGIKLKIGYHNNITLKVINISKMQL